MQHEGIRPLPPAHYTAFVHYHTSTYLPGCSIETKKQKNKENLIVWVWLAIYCELEQRLKKDVPPPRRPKAVTRDRKERQGYNWCFSIWNGICTICTEIRPISWAHNGLDPLSNPLRSLSQHLFSFNLFFLSRCQKVESKKFWYFLTWHGTVWRRPSDVAFAK